MGKKILAMLLSVLLILGILPQTLYAAEAKNGVMVEENSAAGEETPAAETGSVTRAEWLTELAGVFGFYVEEENYPDNYFSDINAQSDDYPIIMLAAEFGLLDVEAGEAVRPNEPATREFAAQTLNACLGFQLEDGTEYSFSDQEDTVYKTDAQVALNREWFLLSNGCFLPDKPITIAEEGAMLSDAKKVLASAVVDENHQDTYQFAEGVIEVPKGTDVVIDEQDVVTITGDGTEIAEGDTFVVWPSEMPSIYVAKTVAVNGDVLTITTEEANTSEAVLAVDVSGTVDVDLSQFEEADGVAVTYVRSQTQARSLAQTYDISVDKDSIVAKKEIKLRNGIKATVVCNLSDLSVSRTIDLKNRNFYVAVNGTSSLTGTVSLDAAAATLGTSTVTLGSIRVAGVGKVELTVNLALNGKITAVYMGNVTAGMQYSPKNGFRLVKKFVKKSFTTVAEANASIGLKMSVGLDLLALEGNIYATTGVSATLNSNTYNDGKKPNRCTQISAWLFATVGAEAKVDVGIWSDSWSKAHEVYTSSNSPVRLLFHYEDGKKVSACTRTDQSGKKTVGYVTPEDSKYGTSSYGEISATETGSDGSTEVVWEYSLNRDQEVTITGYKGRASVISIPTKIDGYPVIGIGRDAFRDRKSIVSVEISCTIAEIGEHAFRDCTYLKSITMLPNNKAGFTVEIKRGAFRGCSSLDEINLSGNVINLGGELFADCTALKQVVLPEGIQDIGYSAFSGCKSLQKLVLPESVTSLGGELIKDTSIRSMVIPKNVKTSGSLGNDSTLEEVTFEEGMSVIPGNICSGGSSIKAVHMPASVVDIGSSAFAGCISMGKIKFPDSIEKIGYSAFWGCKSLVSLEIPSSVAEIEGHAFRNCINLKSITMFPNDKAGFTVEIKGGAFRDCSSLDEINLSGNVINLGSDVFAGCTALKQVVLPEGIQDIGGSAFSGCKSLQKLVLPESVTSLGGELIKDTSIRSMVIPKNVKTSGSLGNDSTLEEVTFEEGMSMIPADICRGGSNITSINIPSTIKTIGRNAFHSCTNLTTINYTGTESGWNAITINTGNDPLTNATINWHTHSYDAGIVTEPTCTEQGYTTYTCATCGNSYKDRYTDPLGHTEVKDPAKAATCTTDGFTEGSHCSVCNMVLTPQEIIKAPGHALNNGVVTTRPTCTADGTKTYTCTVCHETTTEPIPAIGHDFSISMETTPPTCIAEGVKTYYCTNCGESKTEPIPTVAHTYQPLLTPPACTEMGYTTYTCTVCGDHYRAEFTPPAGHNYKTAVTAPTCTEPGYTTHTCTGCNDSYTDTRTEPLGHDYDEGKITIPPTGDKDGEKTFTCRRCGETRTERIPVTGHTHNYDKGTITKEPTCTKPGEKTYRCTGCDDSYTEPIPAKGHDYKAAVTAPTCTGQGYTTHTCAACGDSYADTKTDALGHNYDEGIITVVPTEIKDGVKTYTCRRCGETRTEPVPALGHTHHYDKGTITKEPTCTKPGEKTYRCTGCDDSYTEPVPAKGHDYKAAVTAPTCIAPGYTTHTCAACGDSYTDAETGALGHDYDEGVITTPPTGDKDGVKTFTCRRCSETRTERIPATGHTHTYDEGTITKEPTCTKPGEKTYRCTGCDDSYTESIPAKGHDYKAAVTAPTCTEQGYTTHTCAACGDSYTDTKTDAIGHDYDDGVITVSPTETKDGVKTFTCRRCGETRTETIPATGHTHTYDEGRVSKEPTCTESGEMLYRCTGCDSSYIEEIPAAGHSYKETITEPTCVEKGFTAYTCAACGDSYTDNYTDALGHDYDNGVITTPATERTDGVKTYTCRRCGAAKTEPIPATGHTHTYETDIIEASVGTDGSVVKRCTGCGDTQVTAVISAPKALILPKTSYTYTGHAVTPGVTVTDSNGGVISPSDYTISYSRNKAVGTASVTVTLEGNYTGTLTAAFTIVPKGTALKKLTAKQKGFLVSWKKQTAQVTGYEIQYSTNKAFTQKTTASKTVKKAATVKLTVKKQKAGQKYYVRIRTYKSVKGRKFYSDWSTAKTVKTKK